MAIGRISGQMLKANLLRSGVDLAFETNLLVLDVTNSFVGIGTATPARQLHLSGTGALRLPSGTDAQRGTSANGDIRYNTDQGYIEGYSNGTWKNLTDQGLDAVVEDSAPQLGGDLDVQSRSIITSVTNGNVTITPNGTGSVVMSKVDIGGGEIDGTTIGANSAAAGTFTNLTANGTINIDGDGAGDNIDGVIIGANLAAAGTFTSLTANTGFTAGGAISIQGDGSSAANIDGVTIGATTPAAGTFTSIAGTGLSVGDGNITNVGDIDIDSISSDNGTDFDILLDDNSATALEIKEGSNSYMTFVTTNTAEQITVDKKLVVSNGVTFQSNTVDINGGAIDGTIIGANSAAAGTFTTVDTSGNVTVGGNLTVNGTTTTIESTTLQIEDPLLILAKNNSGGAGNTYDQGILFNRGSLSNVSFLWDESADEFVFANTASETGATAGNVTIDSYASIKAGAAVFTGNVSTTGTGTFSSGLTTSGSISIQGDGSTLAIIDGVTIGSVTPAAGTFTTLTANTGFTANGAIDIDGDGAGDNIDGVIIGANLAAAGTFTTVNAGNGLTAGGAISIQGDGSSAANIDGVIIGASTPAAGTFTDLTANGEFNIDGVRISDNDISATRSNDNLKLSGSGTGFVQINSVDINGGSINGTVIGGDVRSSSNFTSVNANTGIDIDADNAYLRIGTGNDLRLGHDGTDSLISNYTGNILINTQTGTKTWINSSGLDTDFQVSGDNSANLLYVDASADKIGIGTATPSYSLDAGSVTDAIRLPNGTSAERPTAATGVIRFNSQLGVYEGSTDGSTWSSFAMGGAQVAINKVSITGDGSTSTFNGFFSSAPASANNVMVFIDNVYQEPTENYTVSSNNISFTSAPHSGARIFAIEGFDNTSVQTGGVARSLTESVNFESAATTIMSFNATTYRSAELYVQVTDSGNTEYSCMKAHVIHNGTTAFINTYGIVNTGASDSVTLSATYSSGTVNVQAISTGGSSSAIVQYSLAAV